MTEALLEKGTLELEKLDLRCISDFLVTIIRPLGDYNNTCLKGLF